MRHYDELVEIPFPNAATLCEDVVQVQLSVADHVRNIKRTVSKSIFLGPNSKLITSPTVEVVGVVSSVYSPSGALKAVLRETENGSDKKRYVEIWRKDDLLVCKDVSDVHGIFYADDFFSSLSFSSSEKYIIYVAEKKKPSQKEVLERSRYVQSFGEALVQKTKPIVFLFEWESDKLSPLTYDAPVYFGQAAFVPSKTTDGAMTLIATGYETTSDERLLGIRSCYNHPSGIWEIKVPPPPPPSTDSNPDDETSCVNCQLRKLTPSHLSCRSPRIISRDGKDTLIWVSNPTGGAHSATGSLHSLDITSTIDFLQTKTLVDSVWEPEKGEFPGLYIGDILPRHPHVHLADGDYIVTPTTWGSRWTIVLISLSDGTVKELTPVDGPLYSWTAVLTAHKNRIVCVRDSITTPFELVLGTIEDDGSVSWTVINRPTLSDNLRALLDSLTVKVVPIPERFPTETVLVQHTDALQEQKILPLVSLVHGGPHGADTVAFLPWVVALALEGYTISLPNYTGSTGFGEKYIRAVMGQCGTLDVGDCVETVRHLVKLGVAEEGPGKQFICGGSHGGFLTGHLVGQYPDMFTAAVLRNPVISAGEISTSDIEDWYFAEFGLDYPMESLPLGYTGPSSHSKTVVPPRIVTPETYSILYNASPIAHVQNVKAPVLLFVGDSDQRVAPTQGIRYYHALKALGTHSPDDVEMFMLKGEGHGLGGVEAAKLMWTRTAEWFKRRAVT